MPARRWFIAYMPVEHINGKMAPVAYKVANVPEGTQPDTNSFWYGYRHKYSPDISRYGIRSQHRMLEEHPYTASEEENRTLFRMALENTYLHREIAGDWELCLQDFDKQKDYKTALGYAIATCRANNGEWPEDWEE